MALNYETLIHAASKPPEQRTTTEINDFIFPWLKQSLKKKQGIFQKISDDVIHDICKTIMIERRPAWDVVIHQGDPGDTFYIILQGSVNIYRFDEDGPKPAPLEFDTVKEFAKFDADPETREELIAEAFGNFVVTLVGGFDFGERALITNEPRSATVMTTTPTDLLVVGREVFSRTLKAAHEKELQEKTEFINRCPLFSSWSARLKRLVSLSLERGRYSYDSMLYKQGLRADAVYFIWSGEIKLTMDPLLHWIQYPYLLPQSDPMKQRALELYLPLLQPSHPSNVHGPFNDHMNDLQQSFAIKRRHMTFAEAEQERGQRILQLALLGVGDVIGLECYVCDLATHINSARCTAPCDLFYILKHNFARLQKRHGTQDLGERLRDIVRLSLQAYPSRIMHLPLFTAVMKRKLAPPGHDEQHQNKQSWLLRVSNSPHRRTRQSETKNPPHAARKQHSLLTTTGMLPAARTTRLISSGNPATLQYVTNDSIRVANIEDRLKRWHERMGGDSKTHIVPLTRYSISDPTTDNLLRLMPHEMVQAQPTDVLLSISKFTSGYTNETTNPRQTSFSSTNELGKHVSPYAFIDRARSSSTTRRRSASAAIIEERYEGHGAWLQEEYKDLHKRSTTVVC